MTGFFDNKKVLVTGGTGMIGKQLVGLLLAEGAAVRVASLDDPSRADPDVEFMNGDLTNWESCSEAVRGMECVFHLAGIKGSVGIGRKRAASFLVPHLLMNTMLMEAARRAEVERLLYTSSIAVYHPVEVFREDHAWDGPPHETDKYAAWAKRMGELQAEAYREEYGWNRIAIVRPANVYGPYDNFDPATAMVVPALIARVASGEDPLVVWGDGTTVRDFIFSRDCAEGMLLALEKAADTTPINLGSGTGTTIREVVDSITRCFPRPPDVRWDRDKPAGQPIRLMDTTRAERLLGFKARTGIGDGVRETVEWYLANRNASQGRYSVFAREQKR